MLAKYTPTGDFHLDWSSTNTDGSTMLTSASGAQVNVAVSTPFNSEKLEFALDKSGELASAGNSAPVQTEIEFGDAVTNVNFQLTDVDREVYNGAKSADQVIVRAYDAEGKPVAVTFKNLQSGQAGKDGLITGSSTLNGEGVTVNIAGPVTRIEIEHDNSHLAPVAGKIGITDLGFDLKSGGGATTEQYVVDGTAGDDVIDVNYTGDPEGDMVDHNDSQSGNNKDEIRAGAGNDTIYSGDAVDRIYGGTGNDTMHGEGGQDFFYQEEGFGTDTIFGGADHDAVSAEEMTSDLNVTLTGNGAGTMTDGTNTATFSEIERVTTGSGDDVINASAATIGIDLFGGEGADDITGGSGNDVINSDGGDDVIDGGAGNDSIRGHEGDDTIFGGSGVDKITGDAGNDTIDGGDGDDQISGDDGDDTISGGDGIDFIYAGQGADTITGGSGNDTINLGKDMTGQEVSGGDGAADTVVLLDGFGKDLALHWDIPTDNGDGTYTGIDKVDVSNLHNAAGDPVTTELPGGQFPQDHAQG